MSNSKIQTDIALDNMKVEDKETKRKAIIREIVTDIILIVCLVVVFVIFYHFCSIGKVSGESMEPTFENGDLMIGIRHFSLNYGDVVIANTDKASIVKRVIGMAGDEIDIRDNKVYRNGIILNEDYIKGRTYAYDELITFPLAVGEGQVFLLGDNREKSADSRSSKYGLVDVEDISSKVTIRIPVLLKRVIIGAFAIIVVYLILSIIKDKRKERKVSELAAKDISKSKEKTVDGEEIVTNTETFDKGNHNGVL